MNQNDVNVQKLIDRILNSRKYRDTGLNPITIRDLIHQEASKAASQKTLLKAVRRKLHNIVAPYLGEPDYAAWLTKLSQITNTSLDSPDLRAFCLNDLADHASTAERIPYMAHFYDQLFTTIGQPTTILDLACGLHPLAFPWMGLPTSTQYHAYDILQARIDFINHFFKKIELSPLAENRDILVNPPSFRADLGIFFKEAHRFEKRQPGCNRTFWSSLNVDTLAVSLPTQNLSGTHSLLDQHRSLVYENLPINKPVKELIFEDEIVFLIEKPSK